MFFYSGYSNSERCWCKQPDCPSGEGSLFSAHVRTQHRISGCPCNDSAVRIHEILQRWYLHYVIQSCVPQRRRKCRIPYSYSFRRSCTYMYRNKCTISLKLFKHTIFIKIGSRRFYKGSKMDLHACFIHENNGNLKYYCTS